MCRWRKMAENEWIAEGFSFRNMQDAQLAQKEKKKIEYLEAHMDYSNPESIITVYKKAINDRVFRTPVGILYLKHLQEFLQREKSIEEEIPSIPLYLTYEVTLRDRPLSNRRQTESFQPKQKKSIALPISIILNIGLVIAVIAMFAIALKSEHPNIINYKSNLINQYASWEQELKQRESVIREKERDLGLQ